MIIHCTEVVNDATMCETHKWKKKVRVIVSSCLQFYLYSLLLFSEWWNKEGWIYFRLTTLYSVTWRSDLTFIRRVTCSCACRTGEMNKSDFLRNIYKRWTRQQRSKCLRRSMCEWQLKSSHSFSSKLLYASVVCVCAHMWTSQWRREAVSIQDNQMSEWE